MLYFLLVLIAGEFLYMGKVTINDSGMELTKKTVKITVSVPL